MGPTLRSLVQVTNSVHLMFHQFLPWTHGMRVCRTDLVVCLSYARRDAKTGSRQRLDGDCCCRRLRPFQDTRQIVTYDAEVSTHRERPVGPLVIGPTKPGGRPKFFGSDVVSAPSPRAYRTFQCHIGFVVAEVLLAREFSQLPSSRRRTQF